MKWKWFALVGVALLLGGLGACEPRALYTPLGKLFAERVGDKFPECGFPGAEVPAKTNLPPDQKGCYYILDIQELGPKCDDGFEVKATIAISVVKKNTTQMVWREIFPDQPADAYRFHKYTFKVNEQDFSKLAKGKMNVPFFGAAGSAVLTCAFTDDKGKEHQCEEIPQTS